MARKRAGGGASNLPPPYLKRVWLDETQIEDASAYPFVLPFLRSGFDLHFSKAVTIIVGENGVGKSTLIEGIAALAGYDEAGGGKGYRPVDHERALDTSGSLLAKALRAAWRPRVTDGWFFKAETFFSVARYLDDAAREVGRRGPDYLSHSHGEGFMRFFEERLSRQGVYVFDEPESALSPSRQIDFMKVLRRMQVAGNAQVIMATHAPILMALPGADLWSMTHRGIEPVLLEQTHHFRLMREFCADPRTFIEAMLI